uniref:Uncharacterized protein n=1 Tax=viral metagenome TaxID=1070528 RepID=A0A6C0EBZ2_9ZZZZ
MDKNYSKPEGYKNINQSQIQLPSNNDDTQQNVNAPGYGYGYYQNVKTYVISVYRYLGRYLHF